MNPEAKVMTRIDRVGISMMAVIALSIGCSDDSPTMSEDTGDCGYTDTEFVDNCAEGTSCYITGTTPEGTVSECRPNCTSDAQCTDGRVCEDSVCADAPVMCNPTATQSECDCGFAPGAAFLVQGTGDDCVVLETERDACFSQSDTCLNACVDEFFRYDLGDGTALIIIALQGGISQGWTSDGQGVSPSSCPALQPQFPDGE